VPDRTSVSIDLWIETEIVGTMAKDVSIWSEVSVSLAVSAAVIVANAVCVATVDTTWVEL
jgi:hypothetical protein